MLCSFTLPKRGIFENPYTIHVWGPGVAKRKADPGGHFPTVVLRGEPGSSNFLLLEKVSVLDSCDLQWSENNNTARIYTHAALICYYDDRFRCFGGQVFCDGVDKAAVIAHALKETSSCK